MSYLPDGMPSPQPNLDDAPYWHACQEMRLVIRHCDDCNAFFHPPMPRCPRCGGAEVTWRAVSGAGTVYTYSIGHHAVHPALRQAGPYNVVVVLLDGADDVRIVSNLIDVAPEDLRIGLPVEVCFEAATDGTLLPRFRLRGGDGTAQEGGAA